jgi:hypothetical protein
LLLSLKEQRKSQAKLVDEVSSRISETIPKISECLKAEAVSWEIRPGTAMDCGHWSSGW